jgi:hypothetical protein
MVFNGANAGETVDVSANGSRLKFFRNPGNVTMDTAGIERVDFNALGGVDTVTVNDLSGTGVTGVNVDLAGTLGGVAGDGQADRVLVNATNGNDAIDVSGNAAALTVNGLAPTTRVLHSEVANDNLEINTLAGTDTVNSGALAPGAIRLRPTEPPDGGRSIDRELAKMPLGPALSWPPTAPVAQWIEQRLSKSS